jgi:gluconokinase
VGSFSRAIVIMGVSGSGKSTIGALLASSLNVAFIDADDLHPSSNKEKMTVGIPLDDVDRRPWLVTVGEKISSLDASVCACSALKREYRDILRSARQDLVFIELSGSKELIQNRLNARAQHFMSSSLTDSQFETLESLDPDELGFEVRIDNGVEVALATIIKELGGLDRARAN